MSLIASLGGTTALFAALFFVSCAQNNSLHERIGEERESCNTRIEQVRADAAEQAADAERDAAQHRRKSVTRLQAEIEAYRVELIEREAQIRNAHRRLETTLSRLDQEDREWADTSVPRYLLPD